MPEIRPFPSPGAAAAYLDERGSAAIWWNDLDGRVVFGDPDDVPGPHVGCWVELSERELLDLTKEPNL